MKNYIKIESDCFFITERLKEIDKSYFVLFNLQKKCYEVHSSEQRASYCFSLPYPCLDERAVDYALKTRIEKRDEILKELDKENAQNERLLIHREADKIKELLCL